MMLSYSDAYKLSRGDLLNLSFAVSLASLKTIFAIAAVIDLFTIIQYITFEAYFLNVQVRSIMCCQKLSNTIVKKHKQECGVPYNM